MRKHEWQNHTGKLNLQKKTPFSASELEKKLFGRITINQIVLYYTTKPKQKTMKKRNDILLFVQDRATRENNIKGRIDLRDFGALTVGDSLCHWEGDYLFGDEDGNTVDDCGHIVYGKSQENDQWGTFWVGEKKYTFTDLETIALFMNELYDAFVKAYRRGEMHAKDALKSLRKDAETSKTAKLALKTAFELEEL